MNSVGVSFLLIAVILFISLLLVRLVGTWLTRRISWRRNILGACVYLGFLVVLFPLSCLLPSKDFIQTGEGHNPVFTLDRSEEMSQGYEFGFSPEGELHMRGVVQNSCQTFPQESQSLTIAKVGLSNPRTYFTYIQRKDADDGIIEVSTYVPEAFAGRINITKCLQPPEMTLKKGELTMTRPPSQNLNFTQFRADFTVNQFKNINPLFMGPIFFDNQYIVVRVPQSMKIDKSSADFIVKTP